ncbi:hypothetical protein GF420_01550, partial [candidate division GN15 bacterium]|nr:hypothetical protein [candidate division GN15 bacterium]
MFQDGLLMLVILNPFAQMVYLGELMNETDVRTFVKIFVQATVLTTIICLIFAESGEFILYDVFQVRFSTMRIFGGLIVFSLAFVYI